MQQTVNVILDLCNEQRILYKKAFIVYSKHSSGTFIKMLETAHNSITRVARIVRECNIRYTALFGAIFEELYAESCDVLQSKGLFMTI